MKAEWFAKVNDQEYGPYTWQQMLQMAAEGRVPADLPVKRSSDKKWFAARQVPGLVTPAPAAAAPPAPPRPAKEESSHRQRARPLASASASAATAAPPPVPPPPPAAPPPVATNSPWPVIVTDAPKVKEAAPAVGTTAESKDREAPRSKRSLFVVGTLASVALVVLLAGGIGIWAVWFRQAVPLGKQQVAVATPASAESSGAAVPLRKAASQIAAEKESETTSTGPTKSELDAQEKTVSSISTWQNLAGVRSFGVSNASLQVMRVWRTDAQDEDDKQKSAGPHICVEVLIRNKSRSPLKYKGWNSFGDHGAILADESNQILPLVPIAKTPDLTRLSSSSVPGNGTVTELLVFAAPASEEEVLHLVLPYSVFYSNVRPPHRAIELTPDLLGTDLSAANSVAASESGGGESAAATEEVKPAEPSPGADQAAAKGPDKKPKSLRDMINSEPGPPARTDDPPASKNGTDEKAKGEKSESEKGDPGDKKKKDDPKKPENPFEPTGEKSLDPLDVVPKGEDAEKEP